MISGAEGKICGLVLVQQLTDEYCDTRDKSIHETCQGMGGESVETGRKWEDSQAGSGWRLWVCRLNAAILLTSRSTKLVRS